jgi:hypothetical protein
LEVEFMAAGVLRYSHSNINCIIALQASAFSSSLQLHKLATTARPIGIPLARIERKSPLVAGWHASQVPNSELPQGLKICLTIAGNGVEAPALFGMQAGIKVMESASPCKKQKLPSFNLNAQLLQREDGTVAHGAGRVDGVRGEMVREGKGLSDVPVVECPASSASNTDTAPASNEHGASLGPSTAVPAVGAGGLLTVEPSSVLLPLKDRTSIPPGLSPKAQRAWEHYRKLGSPWRVVAPMVDQSELPFRMLCRKNGADAAYTPMLHSRLFVDSERYRKEHFTTCPVSYPCGLSVCWSCEFVLVRRKLWSDFRHLTTCAQLTVKAYQSNLLVVPDHPIVPCLLV